MFDFLQLKFSFFVFLIILFLCFLASGLEIGVSPSSLSFEGNKGEMICKNLSIYSSKNGVNLYLTDHWSYFGGKEIKDYYISSENFSILISYPESIIARESKIVDICIFGEKEGKFYGVLEISSENRLLDIGIWMNAKIGELEGESKNTYVSRENLSYFLLVSFIFANFLLILIFGYFVLVYLKKIKEN